MRPKRLGRGLSNLIPPNEPQEVAVQRRMSAVPPALEPAAPDGAVQHLPVQQIRTNPFQPRTVFAAEALEELTASIREHGVLQPIVVRPGAAGGYEIVAGERRVRAAQAAGLDRIPALVRAATDEEMQTLALVENLQREDLNGMEKARALRAMMRNFGVTQDDVARRVGKARTTVANLLRLLDLPAEVQELVESGALSTAHARAVLQAQGAERRVTLARLAAAEGLSVRDVERRARSGPTIGKRRGTGAEDPYVRDLQDRLKRALSTDVQLRPKGKGGRIEIRYHDADELDRLLDLLGA